jgi:hypothetical protein
LIHISPVGYCAIEPAVVAQLRSAAGGRKAARKSQTPIEPHDRIADLERPCTGIITEFQLLRVRGELSRIERENGL